MSARLLRVAFACLGVGAGVYLFVRPTAASFVPSALHLPVLSGSWMTSIFGPLPTALHVLALSLLTAMLLDTNARGARFAAASWTTINIAFEIGQHASVAPALLAVLPAHADGHGLLAGLHAYFSNGVFDPLDIAAAMLGGITALALMLRKPSTGEASCN